MLPSDYYFFETPGQNLLRLSRLAKTGNLHYLTIQYGDLDIPALRDDLSNTIFPVPPFNGYISSIKCVFMSINFQYPVRLHLK